MSLPQGWTSVELCDKSLRMLASSDWWGALPWAERLHMNRLMFRPLGRTAHIGLYFVLSMLAEASNDNRADPPPLVG